MVLRGVSPVWVCLVVASLAVTAGCIGPPRPPEPPPGTVMIPAETSTPAPLPTDGDDLRWRDIDDQPYSPEFREYFSYDHPDAYDVTVEWTSGPAPLKGALTARGLKPNFAYQLKFWARKGLVGATEEANRHDPLALSGYRLGTVGRWWCEECAWNVDDADLDRHVEAGHTVMGYLLFDWFVTDPRGNAHHAFQVDSSYHVLWTRDQRRPRRNDPPPREYEFSRERYGYEEALAGTRSTVLIFPEWEVNRPLPGMVRLPPGEYDILLDITEESFHANLRDPHPLGGFWARVLAETVRFTVEPASGAGP